MGKTFTKLDSSDEIRERLSSLEDAGVDLDKEVTITYAEGYDGWFDGVIIEAEVPKFDLYFANECWEDERDDAYWADDANRHAERMYRLG